jgi:hypothetical protein
MNQPSLIKAYNKFIKPKKWYNRYNSDEHLNKQNIIDFRHLVIAILNGDYLLFSELLNQNSKCINDTPFANIDGGNLGHTIIAAFDTYQDEYIGSPYDRKLDFKMAHFYNLAILHGLNTTKRDVYGFSHLDRLKEMKERGSYKLQDNSPILLIQEFEKPPKTILPYAGIWVQVQNNKTTNIVFC